MDSIYSSKLANVGSEWVKIKFHSRSKWSFIPYLLSKKKIITCLIFLFDESCFKILEFLEFIRALKNLEYDWITKIICKVFLKHYAQQKINRKIIYNILVQIIRNHLVYELDMFYIVNVHLYIFIFFLIIQLGFFYLWVPFSNSK